MSHCPIINTAIFPTVINYAEENSVLSRDLSESIKQLSTTLSSMQAPPDGELLTKFFFAASVVFVGAFSAYLFNLLHWKMVERKRIESRIYEALVALIEDLESMSIKYWVQDYKVQEKEEIYAVEVALKSKIRLITHLIRDVKLKLKSNKKNSIIHNLDEFHLVIFDLVTGDQFESKTRKASKTRAMKISFRCSDIKAKISSFDLRV